MKRRRTNEGSRNARNSNVRNRNARNRNARNRNAPTKGRSNFKPPNSRSSKRARVVTSPPPRPPPNYAVNGAFITKALQRMAEARKTTVLFPGDIVSEYQKPDRMCSEKGKDIFDETSRTAQIRRAGFALDDLMKVKQPDPAKVQELKQRIMDLRFKVIWCYMARAAARNAFQQMNSGHEYQLRYLTEQLEILNGMLATLNSNNVDNREVYGRVARVFKNGYVQIPPHDKRRYPLSANLKVHARQTLLKPMSSYGYKPDSKSLPRRSPPRQSSPRRSSQSAPPAFVGSGRGSGSGGNGGPLLPPGFGVAAGPTRLPPPLPPGFPPGFFPSPSPPPPGFFPPGFPPSFHPGHSGGRGRSGGGGRGRGRGRGRRR